MIIETKFSEGDWVFFMHQDMPHKRQITNVSYNLKRVMYFVLLRDSAGLDRKLELTYPESEVFGTLEGLLKHLENNLKC